MPSFSLLSMSNPNASLSGHDSAFLLQQITTLQGHVRALQNSHHQNQVCKCSPLFYVLTDQHFLHRGSRPFTHKAWAIRRVVSLNDSIDNMLEEADWQAHIMDADISVIHTAQYMLYNISHSICWQSVQGRSVYIGTTRNYSDGYHPFVRPLQQTLEMLYSKWVLCLILFGSMQYVWCIFSLGKEQIVHAVMTSISLRWRWWIGSCPAHQSQILPSQGITRVGEGSTTTWQEDYYVQLTMTGTMWCKYFHVLCRSWLLH